MPPEDFNLAELDMNSIPGYGQDEEEQEATPTPEPTAQEIARDAIAEQSQLRLVPDPGVDEPEGEESQEPVEPVQDESGPGLYPDLDERIEEIGAPEPEGASAMHPHQVVGSLLLNGLTHDQIRSIPDEHANALEEAIQEAAASGNDPEQVVETFAYWYKDRLEREQLKADVENIKGMGGWDEETAQERHAMELQEKRDAIQLQSMSAEYDAAVTDANLALEDAGLPRITEERIGSTIRQLGIGLDTRPQLAVKAALAVIAVGGDPIAFLASKAKPVAPDGPRMEGKGPRARYIVPAGGTAPTGSTLDQRIADLASGS